MAKKPVKEAIKKKLSISEQPKSKGELVPVKPRTTSRVPKVSGILGKLAKGAVRRHPLLDLLLQNLPDDKQISENIKKFMDDKLKEDMSRRELFKRALRGAGKTAAGALVDKRALLEAIINAGQGAVTTAPAPIVQSIEEKILEALEAARGNAGLRRKIIERAYYELKLDAKEETHFPILERDPDTGVVVQVDEFNMEAGAVAKRIDQKLGAEEDSAKDQSIKELEPGYVELEEEVMDEWQTGKELDDQNRIEQGLFRPTSENKEQIKEQQKTNPPEKVDRSKIDPNDRVPSSLGMAEKVAGHLDDRMRENLLEDSGNTEDDIIQIGEMIGDGEDALMSELLEVSDELQRLTHKRVLAERKIRSGDTTSMLDYRVALEAEQKQRDLEIEEKQRQKVGRQAEDVAATIDRNMGTGRGSIEEGLDPFVGKAEYELLGEIRGQHKAPKKMTESEAFRRAIALKDHLNQSEVAKGDDDPFISFGESALYDEVIKGSREGAYRRDKEVDEFLSSRFLRARPKESKSGFKEFSRRADRSRKFNQEGDLIDEQGNILDDEIPF